MEINRTTKGKTRRDGLAQRSGFATPEPRQGFKSLGVAKRYCRRDSIGDNFVQGAMTKYWTFARGGAWRNPKPTGGLYVCEQCRLDARSGNDSTPHPAGCHGN